MEMTTTYDNEPDTSIAPSHVESSDDGWRVSKVLMGGKERKGTEGKVTRKSPVCQAVVCRLSVLDRISLAIHLANPYI
jgi:hypothetical protein